MYLYVNKKIHLWDKKEEAICESPRYQINLELPKKHDVVYYIYFNISGYSMFLYITIFQNTAYYYYIENKIKVCCATVYDTKKSSNE